MRKMIAAFAAVGLGLVALSLLFTSLACRSFIYHPTQLTKKDVDGLAEKSGWERADLAVDLDVHLVGLVRRPKADDAAWVLFFGGNGADLAGNQSVLDLVRRTDDGPGLAVFAYRGYDGSGGRPTERALEDDAIRIAEWLEKSAGLTAGRLIVMGQSLGTGVASSLAARLSQRDHPPLALILISPFTSMARLFEEHAHIPVGSAVRDPFYTDRVFASITAPILILHGDADTLIPPDHARALKDLAGERAKLVLLEKRGHNDVWGDPAMTGAIRAFVAELNARAHPAGW